jgi:hypothetical protein
MANHNLICSTKPYVSVFLDLGAVEDRAADAVVDLAGAIEGCRAADRGVRAGVVGWFVSECGFVLECWARCSLVEEGLSRRSYRVP